MRKLPTEAEVAKIVKYINTHFIEDHERGDRLRLDAPIFEYLGGDHIFIGTTTWTTSTTRELYYLLKYERVLESVEIPEECRMVMLRHIARVKRYIVAERVEEVSDDVMTLIYLVMQETFFPVNLRETVGTFINAFLSCLPVRETDPAAMAEINNRYYTELAIRAILKKNKPLIIRYVSQMVTKEGRNIPLADVGRYIQDYNAWRMR